MNSMFMEKEDALKGLDLTFLKENGSLVETYRDLRWDSIDLVNKLVSTIEQVVLKYRNPNNSIKNSLDLMFKQLLQKYPLFFGYWKKYTAVSYQLFGLEKSISVLAKSVEVFPTSLELWCDYLNVLCANNSSEVELIRNKFRLAASLIGFQFLSESFWDKYIEFETKHSEWDKLGDIYKTLITIPLHQYARYGTAFRALLNSDRTSIKDFNIDSEIKKTQGLVNAVWPFESKIKQSFFNLSPVSEEELGNWDQYLKFLVDNKEKLGLSKDLIKSAFERSLVPCYYYDYFWGKYLKFLRDTDEDIVNIIDIYQKGIKILPIESREFRLNFILYLKRNFRKNKEYVFTAFTQTIAYYLIIWPNDSKLMREYLSLLKRYEYSSNIDQTDKEILSKQTSFSNFLNATVNNYLEGKRDTSIPLQDMMTENTFPIVVVELIKINWLVLKNTMQTIKYLNQFSKNSALKSSVAFWLFYYKFEKSSKNFSKLNKFISHLGSEILLPTQIINDILLDYQTFYLLNSNVTNYQSLSNSKGSNDDNSIDPILYSQLKINNPTWTPTKSTTSLDWHKSKHFKSNGHPGIMVEKPQLTNLVIERDSKSFGKQAPQLPTFRNLEKLHQPVKYDKFFSKEYLGVKK